MTNKKYALLVKRADRTEIFHLPQRTVRFGYAPPHPQDLTLFDGALEDIHGEISYIAPKTQNGRADAEPPFHMAVHGPDVLVNNSAVPARSAVEIQLQHLHEIRVGSKYHLTLIEVDQPSEADNTSSSQTGRFRASGTWELLNEPFPHLPKSSQLFLPQLPELYQSANGSGADNSFLSKFLALIESEFLPLQWTVENFDLCLDPRSAPPFMLPWLASWYDLPNSLNALDSERLRKLLAEMPALARQRGTHQGLAKMLALYTGTTVEIEDYAQQSSFAATYTESEKAVTEHMTEVALLDKLRQFFNRYGEFTLEIVDGHNKKGNQKCVIVSFAEKQKWTRNEAERRNVKEQLTEKTGHTFWEHAEYPFFLVTFAQRLSPAERFEIGALIERLKPAYTDYYIKQPG